MLITINTDINNNSFIDSFINSINNELLILDNLIVRKSV
jgi:hypothetical protein